MIRKIIDKTTRERYGFFDDGVAKDCTGMTVTILTFTDDGASIGSPELVLDWDNQVIGTFYIDGLQALEPGVYRLKFRFQDSQLRVDFAPDPNIEQTFKLEILEQGD